MNEMNPGLTEDPLFVGATRPPMRWGVTYTALLFNMVLTMEVFLLTKNLLTLLLCAPIHGICMLLVRARREVLRSDVAVRPDTAAGALRQWSLVEGQQLFTSGVDFAE